MTLRIIAAVVIFTLLPLLVFRGRTLRRYFALDVATYLFAWLLWPQLRGVEPWFAAVVFAVSKLALFSVFLATGENVRWSPARAAVVALLSYSLVLPAMLRAPIDGDEPFYLLVTESLVNDRDVDLTNQYRDIARSATMRPDLRPQMGDPAGARGEQYSRHEPFLPFLLIPGFLIAGLPGAIATIVLFGSLLIRSTLRMFEEEGVPDATSRAIFPFLAFGPPIIFFSARLWPEVPAAFFLVEAIRGARQRRPQRWIPAILLLSLLKLRFLLVALPIMLGAIRRRQRWSFVAILIVALPVAIVWFISGSATNVHSWRELMPVEPLAYGLGLFGLLLDGAAGILFQAPFYILGLLALTRWREMPEGFRFGMLTSLLYLAMLIPRSEWHGGWSPPLRYIAFLAPVLALGAATLWERISAPVIAVIGLYTAGIVVHGIAYPWRLFHIANGENASGEWLSKLFHSDFSRLFPSYIRPNPAALTGAITLLIVMVLYATIPRIMSNVSRGTLRRELAPLTIPIVAIVIAIAFRQGLSPAGRVDLEDAHVIHQGGQLYPSEYTVARFLYRGGWIVHPGDRLSFLARSGPRRLYYSAAAPALIEVAGHAYVLEATHHADASAAIDIPRTGRVVLRCLSGAVNLDRIE